MRTRRKIPDERRSDPLRVELRPGSRRDEPDAAAVRYEPSISGRALEPTQTRQQGLPETLAVESDSQASSIRLRGNEAGNRGNGEHRGRFTEAYFARPVEEARDLSPSDARLCDSDRGGTRDEWDHELPGQRRQPPSKRSAINNRSRCWWSDRHRCTILRDVEVSVLRLVPK